MHWPLAMCQNSRTFGDSVPSDALLFLVFIPGIPPDVTDKLNLLYYLLLQRDVITRCSLSQSIAFYWASDLLQITKVLAYDITEKEIV